MFLKFAGSGSRCWRVFLRIISGAFLRAFDSGRTVGSGLSVVRLCHLFRFFVLVFCSAFFAYDYPVLALAW